MPAISCRDADEICDWYFRDDSLVRLLIHMNEHNHEEHASHFDPIVKGWAERKGRASDYLKDVINRFVRM